MTLDWQGERNVFGIPIFFKLTKKKPPQIKQKFLQNMKKYGWELTVMFPFFFRELNSNKNKKLDIPQHN